MDKSKILTVVLIILLIGDFSYSFLQYYYSPLWGDLEGGIVPSEDVRQVIDDPFGFNAIRTGEKHINPNRFFSHLFLMKYFQNVPILLQYFVDPITSVYLSCAIIKIIVQLLTIYILSFLITGERKIFKKEFLIGAILIAPLFQVYGYYSRMGINDKSTAYTFFYAVPIVMLLFFFKPFFRIITQDTNQKISLATTILLIPLIVILPLSGPLIPGIILITTSLVFIRFLIRYGVKQKLTFFNSVFSFAKAIPLLFLLVFVPISLWSVYSLFLGFYDINYASASISLYERYLRLPLGIYSQITHALGFPMLLILIGVNVYIIKNHFYTIDGQKTINAIKWIGVFSLLYILLLPLGGYRPYRPNIIRYDTIMPVTICLFYAFGATSYFLVRKMTGKSRKKYLVALAIPLLVFTYEDRSTLNESELERKGLEIIANSSDSIVALPEDCTVISWQKIHDYRESELKAELLYLWEITDKKKFFYQRND